MYDLDTCMMILYGVICLFSLPHACVLVVCYYYDCTWYKNISYDMWH